MKKMKFKRILLCALLGSTVALSFKHNSTVACNYDTDKVSVNDSIVVNTLDSLSDSIDIPSKHDVLKEKLINEVDKYIRSKTSKYNSKLPECIVNKCLNHNLDICFVMAQTEIETCYGTAGIGREKSRHSLFGIYKTYPTYDDCIENYIDVLKRKYLTNGRTEHHLMKHYVTSRGSRYAQNPRYEIEISGAYKNIRNKTEIYSMQSEYNNI